MIDQRRKSIFNSGPTSQKSPRGVVSDCFCANRLLATIDFSPFFFIQNLGHNSTMGSPSIIKSPIFNVVFLLVSMQMAKRINWDDPNTLLYARIGYYGAQVLVIGMAYMLIGLIKKRNGMYRGSVREDGIQEVLMGGAIYY